MADSKRTVGIIGTGKMGRPMAENLLKAGYPVVVNNRSQESIESLVAKGATRAETAADVAASAEIIITSLTNQQSVRDVYFGEHGLVTAARPGQVMIDTSTNDPSLGKEIAEKLVEKQASFLDAPVSGGPAGAEAGTLTIMIGGDAEAFEKARPVLDVIGKNLHLLGPVGAGTVIKLVNQLFVGVNMAAVAEGVAMGVKAGADPRQILEVIGTSFGGSAMLTRNVPLMLERKFSGGTPVDLLRKDLSICAGLTESQGLDAPMSARALAVFDAASARGFGGQDMSSIIQMWEADNEIEVK